MSIQGILKTCQNLIIVEMTLNYIKIMNNLAESRIEFHSFYLG